MARPAHPKDAAPRALRKRFWIDPSIQVRMLAFVVAVVAGSLWLAYLSMDHGLVLAAREERLVHVPVEWARGRAAAPFWFAGSLAVIASAVLALLWSHRVVGPLMVLTAGLRRVRDGDLSTEVRLRDTDELTGTARDFMDMQLVLRRRMLEDRGRLESLSSRLAAVSEKLAAAGGGKGGRHAGADLHAARAELDDIRGELKQVNSYFQLGARE